RMIDLDGDGFPDLVLTEDHCLTWYASRGKEGYESAKRNSLPFDEEAGPAIVFSEAFQTVFLADMCGDGLTDIVRITNRSICYWPNLGYGHFGEKVTLDGTFTLDQSDHFEPRRIRLADIDGSGTTDIVYIKNEGVCYFPNLSGNAIGNRQFISQSLPIDDLTSVTVIDLLGNGTNSLVWSSPVPGNLPPSIKYIDLMGGVKPYLLTEVNNNMGSLTRMKYAPSTKFYLKDERNGTPWITKLPFPVQVVERVEFYDEIQKNRFVSTYSYRHGYYDGAEREFRGFGMVEQRDTESFNDFTAEGLFPVGINVQEEVLHVPPIVTRSWFHLGFDDSTHHTALSETAADVLNQYRSEYWNEDPEAATFSSVMTMEDMESISDHATLRENIRALRGSMLRQEVYSMDGSELEKHPYVVTENTYEIKLVQPRDKANRRDNDYSVAFVIPSESMSYQYERNPADPRMSHQMSLETDQYGNVVKSVAIGYARRSGQQPRTDAKQDKTLVTYSETQLLHEDNNPVFYRLGIPLESRTYELQNLLPPENTYYDKAEIRQQLEYLSVSKETPAEDINVFNVEGPHFAIPFNGTSSYAAIEGLNFQPSPGSEKFTAEALVQTSFSGSSMTDNWSIVDFDRSDFFSFYVRGDNGRVGFSTTSSGAVNDLQGLAVVNDGEWHHLAVVYDGTDKIIYVDGVEDVRKKNAHNGAVLGSGRVRYGFIGDGSEATTYDGERNNIYFEGELAEIRLWSDVRAESDLKRYASRRLEGSENNLLLYYDMQQGAGNILMDKSPNGYHGTLHNIPTNWTE
ncbi:MAG: toxin TcdB middle/N-terminal domain-containing protein, partial [Bacteroidota bacterium]